MTGVKRILFVIQDFDPWILDAYERLSDAFDDDSSIEFYATISHVYDLDKIHKYNLVNFHHFFNHIGGLLPDISLGANYRQEGHCHFWTSPIYVQRWLNIFKFFHALINPSATLVWSGMADTRKVVADLLESRNFPIYYAEKGFFPGSWCIDPVGVNGLSSLKPDCCNRPNNTKDKEKIVSYLRKIASDGDSAWEQPKRTGINNSLANSHDLSRFEKIIFFPGQVDDDVNIVEFSPFSSVAEAVELVLSNMDPTAALVVKLHPKAAKEANDQLREMGRKVDNLIIIENANIWDLIDLSDLVISVNSTVAFEALSKQKKIILLGDSILQNVRLVKKTLAKNLEHQIQRVLEHPYECQFDHERFLAFSSYLYQKYYILKNDERQTVVEKFLSTVDDCERPQIYSTEEIMEVVYGKDIRKVVNTYGKKALLLEIMRAAF